MSSSDSGSKFIIVVSLCESYEWHRRYDIIIPIFRHCREGQQHSFPRRESTNTEERRQRISKNRYAPVHGGLAHSVPILHISFQSSLSSYSPHPLTTPPVCACCHILCTRPTVSTATTITCSSTLVCVHVSTNSLSLQDKKTRKQCQETWLARRR